jgi:membrane-associated HD superfamily phosphohydrolase
LTFKDQYYTKAQFTAALTENIAALSEALSELMGKGKDEEVLAAFIEEMTESIDEMFSEQTGTYKISADNKTLTLKFDGEDVVLTRK